MPLAVGHHRGTGVAHQIKLVVANIQIQLAVIKQASYALAAMLRDWVLALMICTAIR